MRSRWIAVGAFVLLFILAYWASSYNENPPKYHPDARQIARDAVIAKELRNVKQGDILVTKDEYKRHLYVVIEYYPNRDTVLYTDLKSGKAERSPETIAMWVKDIVKNSDSRHANVSEKFVTQYN